jgi:hypothetical protein
MNTRALIAILCVSGAALLYPQPAAAHRLDDYLQATRISLDLDRVNIEIDLTPGAAIVPNVVALIDTNGDGEISAAESEAYARLVLASAVLEVDGRRQALGLVSSLFPSIGEMNEGVGVIRLRASAERPPVAVGHHVLVYRNAHQPQLSVYLANALVPASDRIRIAGQQRDVLQHELRFDYSVSAGTASFWMALSWLIAALGCASVITRLMNHSYRNATIGFTRLARRAGK